MNGPFNVRVLCREFGNTDVMFVSENISFLAHLGEGFASMKLLYALLKVSNKSYQISLNRKFFQELVYLVLGELYDFLG